MQKSVSEDREKFIGGSDVPIIMGLSHFKDRFILLLEKAGLKEIEQVNNSYVEYGNIMEPKIRQYINTLFQRNFKEDKLIKDDIRCHFDGIDDDMILEIKTSSAIHENINDYKIYLVQLLFYMMNANIENGMLAIYERPSDFDENFDSDRLQIFTIKKSDYKELCDEINEAVKQFRIDLDKMRSNPFITEEELVNTNVVSLAHEVIKLEKRLEAYKEITKQYDELKAKLKIAMQENNIKTWETPSGNKITLVEDTPSKIVKKFNESKFKEENELLYNKYLEDKEQKGKTGFVRITIGGKNE